MTNKKQQKRKPKTTREIAFLALYEILEEEAFSHLVIRKTLRQASGLEEREKAFIMRLIRGTVEYVLTLDTILNRFSKVKVHKMKPAIRTILRMSVYQMQYMDAVPVHAICNEAVQMTIWQNLSGLKGYVNGVLRAMGRAKTLLPAVDAEKEPIAYLSLAYSVPEWLVSMLERTYGMDKTEQILKSQMQPEPVSVWCNTLCQSLSLLQEKLQKEGFEPEPLPYQLSGFYLHHVNGLEESSAFKEGAFLIQDVSSMLAGEVTAPKKNDFVMDVCAAPGGKSLHTAIMLEGTGKVQAADLTQQKVALITQTVRRTGIANVETIVWDAKQFRPEMEEKADIVIADLPCSGLGIVGRKPEIKYRVQEQDIQALAKLQKEILSVVWQYVKPGGRLIYSTCTITPEENEKNYEWLLENYPMEREDLKLYLSEELHSDTTSRGFLQLLPGVHQCDGFFVASAKRRSK
jgi:16S rRNA (cytosine967-C5)-methyltransferase